jgi:hypothetical protein
MYSVQFLYSFVNFLLILECFWYFDFTQREKNLFFEWFLFEKAKINEFKINSLIVLL